jgi:hypothetical protein
MSRAATEPGREVLSAAERLMDGMLAEEGRCFERIAAALLGLSSEVEKELRNLARAQGLQAVPPHVPDLLPDPVVVRAAVLPPIGDLLAMARDRTLVVVRRQLRAVEATTSARWRGTAERAAREAAAAATAQEQAWFDKAAEKLTASAVDTRQSMSDQALTWWSRKEPLDALVMRWCSPDPIGLPGSLTRGAVWAIRGAMTIAARNSSVALTNGLLLAGMTAWNSSVVARAQLPAS